MERNAKQRWKRKLVIHVESHASAVSLLESGEQRDIKATTTTIIIIIIIKTLTWAGMLLADDPGLYSVQVGWNDDVIVYLSLQQNNWLPDVCSLFSQEN